MKILNSIRAIKNRIINNLKYNKIKKTLTANNEKLIVDIGASSIKMSYKNELINFRSSVRKVIDENEITIQKNSIKINNEWYIIGESNTPTGNYQLKCDKDYLEILIVYGLIELKKRINYINNNLIVDLLIPFNQIFTKKKLEEKINGLYRINYLENNCIQEIEVSLTLDKLHVEGECSKVYADELFNNENKNVCIVNIGYSTIDSTLYNSINNREAISSINIGTNYLLSQYLKYTKASTSSILGSWLNDGYKLTKLELQNIKNVNREFIRIIWNDVYNSCIKNSNPDKTRIILCGGGALLLKNEFLEIIPESFDVEIMNKESAIYSDLLGAMMLSNSNNNIKYKEIVIEEDTTPEPPTGGGSPVTQIAEIKPNNKKSGQANYEKFIKLYESGNTLEEIANKMNMKIGSIYNYRSRYNKETKSKII